MVFAIADLHFDSTGEKPMDIFGSVWNNHEQKIIRNWENNVKQEDIVLLPGDISWALKEEDAYKDLEKIERLPGRKIMIKGNHDYWWNSLKKINDFNFKTIDYIQNNSFIYNNIGIAGTRGWGDIGVSEEVENGDREHNEKIFKRELHRLRLSLDSLGKNVEKKIVMLHYPPFNIEMQPNEFGDILKEYDVDICVYGHLHGDGHQFAKEGILDGIEYHCVACDYIDFNPKKIVQE